MSLLLFVNIFIELEAGVGKQQNGLFVHIFFRNFGGHAKVHEFSQIPFMMADIWKRLFDVTPSLHSFLHETSDWAAFP